jgi:hypothetical protein
VRIGCREDLTQSNNSSKVNRSIAERSVISPICEVIGRPTTSAPGTVDAETVNIGGVRAEAPHPSVDADFTSLGAGLPTPPRTRPKVSERLTRQTKEGRSLGGTTEPLAHLDQVGRGAFCVRANPVTEPPCASTRAS